jgi:hypothetical protein
VSDIDAEVVDSLKVLDPSRPIREAEMNSTLGETSLCANCYLMHRNKTRCAVGIVKPIAFPAKGALYEKRRTAF